MHFRPLAGRIAERFRVMGEPMRIKLLARLRESPATVQLSDPTKVLASEAA